MQLWRRRSPTISRLQAGDPGEPVLYSVWAWRPESQGTQRYRFQSGSEGLTAGSAKGRRPLSQWAVSRKGPVLHSFAFLFHLCPQQIGRCPPALWGGKCSTESTNSDTNFIWKHPHTLAQESGWPGVWAPVIHPVKWTHRINRHDELGSSPSSPVS